MIATIAGRELRSLFLSPVAWSLLAVMQFILAWLFLVQIESFTLLQPRLASMEAPPGVMDLIVIPHLDNLAIIVLMLIPLISMRLISEELRSGTFSLLLSAPVSIPEIILGKYLGVLGMLGIMLAIGLAMALSLLAGGVLDYGRLVAGMLGLVLLLSAAAAIGLFISTLSSQPGVTAAGSYGLLLFLWLINAVAGGDGKGSELFDWIAMPTHFDRLLGGLVRSSDLVYFMLCIVICLLLAMRRLETLRSES